MTTMTQPVAAVPVAAPAGRTAIPAKFVNGQQWIESLGDVPLSRIIFDPWPGTATDRDLLVFVERDKRLCELVDGTLVEKPVGYLESQVITRLVMYLGMFVYPRDLGVVAGADGTLRMASGRVRLPDVSFVRTADLPGGRVPTEPIPTLPPSLAVEVLSPSNTVREMRQKTEEYFASGSRLVWMIDPRRRTVAVFDAPTDQPTTTLTESDNLDGGTVLPGFVLPIADLFRNLTAPSNQD